MRAIWRCRAPCIVLMCVCKQIHAWRVSRCKDVTDGTRRWAGGQKQAEASQPAAAKPAAAQQQQAKPAAQAGGQQTRRAGSACRFGEDMTGKRCFGLGRAPDPAWTPASCKDQSCRRSGGFCLSTPKRAGRGRKPHRPDRSLRHSRSFPGPRGALGREARGLLRRVPVGAWPRGTGAPPLR